MQLAILQSRSCARIRRDCLTTFCDVRRRLLRTLDASGFSGLRRFGALLGIKPMCFALLRRAFLRSPQPPPSPRLHLPDPGLSHTHTLWRNASPSNHNVGCFLAPHPHAPRCIAERRASINVFVFLFPSMPPGIVRTHALLFGRFVMHVG